MLRAALAVLVLATGCGRLAFDVHGDDGGGDSETFGPWSAPEKWMIGPSGDDPALTQDMLEMYLNASSTDLYRTTRATKTDPWSASVLITELDDAGSQSTPELTYDGLTMYFSSARTGTLGGHDVWMSKRATRGDPWGAPVQVVELNSPSAEHPGCLQGDQLAMALDSNRPAGADDDLYISTRPTITSPWGAPTLLTSLSVTGFTDESPCISRDGLELYFDSNRSGAATLYVARRASTSSDFDAPELVGIVDTGAPQYDPWISSDGHDLVFYSGAAMWHSTR